MQLQASLVRTHLGLALLLLVASCGTSRLLPDAGGGGDAAEVGGDGAAGDTTNPPDGALPDTGPRPDGAGDTLADLAYPDATFPDVPGWEFQPVGAGVFILPVGTDYVAVGQSIPLEARVYDERGNWLRDAEVTWASSDESLLSVSPTGVVTGITFGGGDAVSPDGSLFVTASSGGSSDTRILQVVRPIVGTGLDFVATSLSANPAGGAAAPDGSAHYDGLYPLNLSAAALGACSLYVGGDTRWNEGVACTWDKADGRLMVGEQLNFEVRVRAQTDTYDIGWLEFPAPLDEQGRPLAPAVARAPYLTWASSNAGVAIVDGGVVTALSPGQTTISATLGPQTARVRLVVYDQFGYFPFEDFATGAEREDGSLLVFSSSNGPALLGSLDTVRVVDLSDYRNLDYRPSKYGPQGVRLVERSSGANEAFGGGGCGMVTGAGDEQWLLSSWVAIPFDTATVAQAGGLNKVAWHADDAPAAERAKSMCQAAFYERGGQRFLIGFDVAEGDPGPVKVRVANVTNLAQGNVVAAPVPHEPFNQGQARYYSPQIWHADSGDDYLLFVEQGTPNVLHFSRLVVNGATLTIEAPLETDDIAAGSSPNVPNDIGEAPALAVVSAGGNDYALVGNQYTITVIDLATRQIVAYGDDVDDPLVRDLDIRWYGEYIRAFALSPDGATLYALPYHEFEGPDDDGVYRGRTTIDYLDWEGTTRQYDVTNHRVALIDLSAPDRPVLREDPARDPHQCHRSAGCTTWGNGLRFGIDLLHTSLKKWMLDTQLCTSTGQLPPITGLNVRAIAASTRALFAIGRDHPDGVGTALANLSDLSVYDIASGEGVVFRGWRANPQEMMGLSDPFGFRLGEDDAVLGRYRAKNAALFFRPGPAPAENAGDGPPVLPDDALPASDNFANAPDARPESGKIVLLSSSHRLAADGTHDVVRVLDLETYTEQDFNADIAGKQGTELLQGPSFGSAKWQGGCGIARGPGNVVFLFNGASAIGFDLSTQRQAFAGHQITFDEEPASADVRVCAGAYYENGATRRLFAIDTGTIPSFPLWEVDLSALETRDVVATPVSDPFVLPIAGVDAYDVRYVTTAIVNEELWLLEKNDPFHGYRNAIHRARIVGGGLVFDASRATDLLGEYTSDEPLIHDPDFIVAPFAGVPHAFIGNEHSITVYDVGNPAAPERLNYNTDGDPLHDDLDTFAYGRGIMAFAADPGHTRLFALPYQKSAREPKDHYYVPMLNGTHRLQDADRWRMVVLSLADDGQGRPWFDLSLNNGNGIDLVYYFLKQRIVDDWVSPGALPPIFPNFRRAFAVSANSAFLLGFDNDDGAGSALANMTDLAIYDLATGRGTVWRDWTYVDLSSATLPFGFRLGEGDPELGSDRVKNAAVLYVP